MTDDESSEPAKRDESALRRPVKQSNAKSSERDAEQALSSEQPPSIFGWWQDANGSSGAAETRESEDAGGFSAGIDLEKSTLGEAARSLQKLFNYSTSLPERTLRGATAIAGAVRESAGWLIPTSFRNSRSYSIFARQMLEFVVNDIGGVKRASLPGMLESAALDVDLARKTVGNLLDLTALATFHISPITVLAIFSDVAYESEDYMQQLCERLQAQGIVPKQTRIKTTADLIIALEQGVEGAEETYTQPAISIRRLRATLHALQAAVATTKTSDMPTADEVDQLWRQMELAAADQHASVWDISTTMAMIALNHVHMPKEGADLNFDVGEDFFVGQVFEHYWLGLREIERRGLLPALSETSQPYLEAVWSNFSFDRKTWAEQLLSGELIKWRWSRLSWPKLSRELKGEPKT